MAVLADAQVAQAFHVLQWLWHRRLDTQVQVQHCQAGKCPLHLGQLIIVPSAVALQPQQALVNSTLPRVADLREGIDD